ncbi:MAG: polyphosphate polymerase domain-containing protein [Phycisphaerales bacterium]|nr:MAG: polyphosphate polymerase domain-containing protein [Phycisphaerales bacterium]
MAIGQAAQQAGEKRAERVQRGKVRPSSKVKKSADRMLACRYELKYLISEAQAAAVDRYISPFLEYDRYSKLQRGGMYPIVSLYIDSDDMQLCKETLTGQKNRFKLRIRSYTDEPEYPRFFEIKRRLNRVILKSRARVTDQDVPILLAGRLLPPQGFSTDETALNQFQLYTASICAGPKVLIRYMRQAFENTDENRVRVTFDRELCYKVTDKPEVRLGGSGWQPNSLTNGHVILEIKFTGTYPAWLARMAAHFNLQARSVSKFATSIEQACALGFCAPTIRNALYG